jgi:hypothetical protein
MSHSDPFLVTRVMTHNTKYSMLGGKGALIRVDNITHMVKHIFDGVSVSPGMSTNIALKREFKSMLPQPYSGCVVDQGKYNFFDTASDLFNHTITHNHFACSNACNNF